MEILFSTFGLKIIMIILMFLDHVYQFIPGTPIWFTWLGRLVAPVFLFLVAIGIKHTGNRWAYFYRLFLFGCLMFVLNRVIAWIFPYQEGIPNNIFLSLAAAVAFITVLEGALQRGGWEEAFVPLAVIGILSLFTEASFLAIPLVVIFYYLMDRPLLLSVFYILVSLVFFPWDMFYGGSPDAFLYDNYQWMMIAALPFFLLYSGRQGPKFKYLFYLFYPLHIYGLYLLGYFISL